MSNTFDPKTHSYLIDGKPATGITTVIGVLAKPALIGWAAKMAIEYIRENVAYAIPGEDGGFWAIKPSVVEEAKSAHTKKKDAAATHGTDAHTLVEEYIKDCIETNEGKPVRRVGTEYWGPIERLILWACEDVDHFLFSERRMFNKDKFIAGTADFAAVMKDGKKLIGDFKTSSGIFGIDYFLQCAGYKFLAETEGDAPYDGCVIVRLGKKGPTDFDVTYRYDTKTDEEAFMACLTIYRAQQTWKKP